MTLSQPRARLASSSTLTPTVITPSAISSWQALSITGAADLDTWRGMGYQTVLTPPEQKTGDVIYPYAKAKQ